MFECFIQDRPVARMETGQHEVQGRPGTDRDSQEFQAGIIALYFAIRGVRHPV